MPRIVDEAIDYLTERDRHVPPLIAILALVGLGRLARMASLGLAALWLAGQIRAIDRDRVRLAPSRKSEQMVDEAMEESFPASDPPAFSPVISSVTAEVSSMARLRTVH